MVDCNFRKYERWDTVGEMKFDHRYNDFVGEVTKHSGYICQLKQTRSLCDEENCIFIKLSKELDKKQNDKYYHNRLGVG